MTATIYPTGINPLDDGARWSVEETRHEDCEFCMELAIIAGEALDSPANAQLTGNSAASANFQTDDPRAAGVHFATVRRERAAPWTPPAWATTPITKETAS